MVLEKIKNANDIKNLSIEELERLPQEIREFLIQNVSKTGGHLASNLGVVELTIALHLTFDLLQDKIIWDVGHQSYTHKILTGRKEAFVNLRKFGGLSGFPKRGESISDAFNTGHSSTSISAGLGYVQGRDILGETYKVVSIIGDGALTGGMAFEALNNAEALKKNFIIILNDNNMSISENVGGLSGYLYRIRTASVYTNIKQKVEKGLNHVPVVGRNLVKSIRKTKSRVKHLLVPGMFFEDMGITYFGPIDGHNVELLKHALEEAKKIQGPVILHILTHKGRGYKPAELEPARFHGTGPFHTETGLPLASSSGKESYTDVFGRVLCQEAASNANIVAITAAMKDGTGLSPFKEKYPNRFFDVGIAEEHGVTFAAGLAAAGMVPVIALYSSFLQRAYDQVIHDVCLQNLPVVFMVDRAGIVGNDGETHQGIFDISFLSNIPNMTILAPKNKKELELLIPYAINLGKPVAIRYPRGEASEVLSQNQTEIVYGKSEIIYEEKQIALFALGHMMEVAVEARNQLKEQGYSCTLINARFIKPVDGELLQYLSNEHSLIVTLEENIMMGGYGQAIKAVVDQQNLSLKVANFGIDDIYVEQGEIKELRKALSLDKDSIAKSIIEVYNRERL